ncbi:histidine--tRNA ligase [Candidatus Peregrinibacteria bacterium]|jgi:histidyl-tRNA synthetase|nr:histidine--tRNA ligase [Candidatus Peregrinibacteria bacterium]MBT4056510.1 histidine--tRNA ligase [Candidatus Peregrinibacteria bacterium]
MPEDSRFRTPKGVHDILPEDHEYHTYIKKVARHRCRQAGYRRISTPIFEFTDVFKRTVGGDSDIVKKEMYTFEDRKGRSLTLKPEGTAGVARSYIQHAMWDLPQPVELYYIEPNFRYDRPQKGRYRQFWHFGAEILGESDPALDAQCIQLGFTILKDLGIADRVALQLNTIGTPEARAEYRQVLQDYYVGKERSLCEDCKSRLGTNPLRLLDCKEEDCQILADLAPKLREYLDKESLEFHEELKGYLDELGIEYNENHKLVRGLDYYSKTVFEFWDKNEGSQNAIGGGGRYDGLVELLGGPSTPGVGLSFGLERVIANMKIEKIKVPNKDDLHVFVAQLGKEAKAKCLPLIQELRAAGIKTMGAMGKGAIRDQLGLADKFGVGWTVLIGITEVREGNAIIRNMQKGSQETVPMTKVTATLRKKIGEKNLDKYSPGELLYS